MRIGTSVLFMLGLFSVSALACPNLSGTYTCMNDGQKETLVVSQNEVNGATVYQIGETQVVADNVAYTIPDDEELRGGTQRAWCAEENNELKIEILGKIYDQQDFFGDLAVQIGFLIDGSKNLVNTVQGSLKATNGEYPIHEIATCTRD